jgi:hypothetical protein
MLFCAHGRRAQEQTAVPIIVCHAPKNKVPYKVLDTCHTPPLGDIHAHHVFEFADFPEHRFSLWNGVTLCPYCHMKAHGYEPAAKKYFGRV